MVRCGWGGRQVMITALPLGRCCGGLCRTSVAANHGSTATTSGSQVVELAGICGWFQILSTAFTSLRGAQRWHNPLTSKNRKTTGHDSAAVAIG